MKWRIKWDKDKKRGKKAFFEDEKSKIRYQKITKYYCTVGR